MPRSPSDNTYQVALKIPNEWVKMADDVAQAIATSHAGIATTRTDALRAALWRGLSELRREHVEKPKPRKR